MQISPTRRESIVDISYTEMNRRFKPAITLTLDEIFTEIVDIFDENPVEVKSAKKTNKLVTCRMIFCYVSTLNKRFILREVGEFIGSRDHTTVVHNRDKAIDFFETKDPKFMIAWDYYVSYSRLWHEINKTSL